MPKLYKFDSGLTLFYETNTVNKATSVEISFDCGARCDGEFPGLSHFCEHMFFTGTDKLSKQDVTTRYYDFIDVNAFTNNAEIAFVGTIVSGKLGQYLSTVQDMICNSTFKPKAVEEEKKIVIQEIVQDADRHGRHADRLRAYELYKKEYFKYGALGNKESVSKIQSKDVKNYVKKYFVNNNCYVSICSPLSFSKIKKIVKKNFEQLMPTNNLKPLVNDESKLIDGEYVNVYKKDIGKNFVSIAFKFKRSGPDLKYRAIMGTVCNMIDDISDGLTKELRIDNSLIYSMGSDYMINKVNSYMAIYTEISSQNIKPCLDIIINYIKNIIANGFTKEQLKKEQEKDDYYWQTKVYRPVDIKNNLTRLRFYGKFVSDKEIHHLVQHLTLDEINLAVRELFSSAQIQLFVYGNADKKDVYTIKQILKKF